MSRQFRTGLIITGDASGGIKAVRATEQELARLDKGFDRAAQKSKAFAKNVSGSSRELELLKRAAAPIGGILASIFAARTLQGQVDFANNLADINARIGAGTEALSEYHYVAKLAGVELGTLTTAWQRQTRRIDEAARGTGVASKALETLRLNAGELARMAPEAQFEAIAAAMQNVADEGQRVALAQKVWDSGGVQLLQIVNQGTDAIAAQRAEAERYGLTISNETAQAMAAFNAEQERLRFMALGVSRTLMAEVVPALTESLQATSAFIDGLGGANVLLERTATVAGTLAAVYLARRLGPTLLSVGGQGLVAGRNIAAGMAMAAGATGPLNQALVVTQARIAAVNAAGRALRGTMALLGGPAGVAILAAGAMFHFREELGLVRPEVEASSEAVATLTGDLYDLNQAAIELRLTDLVGKLADLRAEAEATGEAYLAVGQDETARRSGVLGVDVTGQTRQIQEIGEASAETRQEIANVESAIELLEGRLEQLNNRGERTPPIIRESGDAAKEAAKAAREQANALEALRREFDPLRAEHARYAERLEVLNRARADGAVGAEEYGEVVRWAAEQYVRAATGAEELEKAQQRLIERYDRHHRRATQLRTDLASINVMYREGVIDGDEYARMVAGIRDEMQQLALDADPLTQDMARAWEEAANRIDEAFADAFRGAFDSFGDFSRQLLDGFKRLLAELAYQATLRPVVVGFTGDMRGLMGIGGQAAQGFGGTAGGIGQLASTGRALFSGNAIGQGFHSLGSMLPGGTTAASGGGIYGQVGGQVSTGGIFANAGQYAGWQYGLAGLGGGLVGAQFGGHGGISGSLGATIGMAAAGPIGAAVGTVLGGALGSLFGRGGTDPSLRLVTEQHGRMPSGQTGWEHHGRAFASSAFGDVGFAAAGTQRLSTLLPDGGEREFLSAIAEMDNLLATLARSESEFQAMAAAARSVEIRGKNAEQVLEQLGRRTTAIVGAVDGEFGAFLATLEGGAEEIVSRAIEAQQSLGLMGFLAGQLSLRFDETANGALTAADGLARLMGGIDAVAQSAEAYFQLTHDEAERQAIALRNAYSALQEFTNQTGIVVESAAGLRDLVEAIDLTSESGRELYTQAMALVPAVDELEQAFARAKDEARALARAAEDDLLTAWQRFERDSLRLQGELLELAGDSAGALALAREQELAAMDASLRPFQERVWALQDEAAAQEVAARAVQDYVREYQRAESQLASTLEQIQRFVDQTRATGGSPEDNLAEADEQFQRQLALAQAGDRSALQSITQYADRLIQSGQEWFASGEGAQQIQRDVLAALEELPRQLTAEEFLADEVRESINRLINELPGGIADLVGPMFDHLDRSLDGVVDYDEFSRFFSGKASDAELRRIFDKLDVTGSGAINRLEAMPGGISWALAHHFDRIDSSLDGVVDYDEFSRFFSGKASDAELRRIWSILDRDGKGQISRLQALAASGDVGNQLAEVQAAVALAELQELQSLHDETQATVNQLVSIDSSVLSVRDAVIALGVAQDRVAQLERERIAREQQTQQQLSGNRSLALDARNTANDALRAIQRSNSISNQVVGILQNNDVWTATNRHMNFGSGRLGTELRSLPRFALGGVFTNQVVQDPTLFNMAEMGEAGPEAIMPLRRGPDGSLGIRAELPALPPMPLLGLQDVAEVLRDLQREVRQLREENRRLSEEGNRHAAAGVTLAQAGFRRLVDSSERTARSNEDLARQTRLEALR